jgi:hypothetical protein
MDDEMTHHSILLCIFSVLAGILIIVALRAGRILSVARRESRIISSDYRWRMRGQIIAPFVVLAILGPEVLGDNWRLEASGSLAALAVIIGVAAWYFLPQSTRRK